MQIKKFNITKSGRKYQDKQGNEKTVWHNIGTLTEFHKDDGTINRVIEIPAIGLDAQVFPMKEDENKPAQPKEKVIDMETNLSEDAEFGVYDEENPEDMPF